MWSATPESRLLSIRVLMNPLNFSSLFFFLSINLLLRRGSCSIPRAPAFKRALVHSWPRTILLEISRRHQTLAITPTSVGWSPSAFRITWGHPVPRSVAVWLFTHSPMGLWVLSRRFWTDLIIAVSLCVKQVPRSRLSLILTAAPMGGATAPISQMTVTRWRIKQFLSAQTERTGKSHPPHVCRKPEKSLCFFIYPSVIRDSQVVTPVSRAEWVQELVNVKTDCHSFIRKPEKPKDIWQIGSEKLK